MKKPTEEVVRKRNLIAKTHKVMLIWVAGAMCVVSAAVVMSVVLVQSVLFSEFDIIRPRNKTVDQLEANIKAVPVLRGEVRVLNTKPQLQVVGVRDDSQPLQAILDALPADGNRLALGASLQQRLFSDIPGLTVESLSVDPSAGGVSVVEDAQGGLQSLVFTASISGEQEAVRTALQRLERSIRAINVQSISATSSAPNVSLQIVGSAYYLPPPEIGLTTKTVSQGKTSNPKAKSKTTNNTQKGSK